MNLPAPSRRALLGALAIAPLAIAPSALAATPIDTLAWDRAVAAYEAAAEASRRHNEQVYDPALARVAAKAPRPPMMFDIPARNGQVATFHLYPGNLHEYDDHMSPAFRDAAAEQRRLWIAHKEAEAAEDIDAIDDEWTRLADESSEAWSNALLTQAPHLAAVAWKLDTLFGEQARGGDREHIDSWHHKYTDAIASDVRRLSGEA